MYNLILRLFNFTLPGIQNAKATLYSVALQGKVIMNISKTLLCFSFSHLAKTVHYCIWVYVRTNSASKVWQLFLLYNRIEV